MADETVCVLTEPGKSFDSFIFHNVTVGREKAQEGAIVLNVADLVENEEFLAFLAAFVDARTK